jgi:hypothetical protein
MMDRATQLDRQDDSPLLVERPVRGGITDKYFYRMLSPEALKLSARYHAEEGSVLETCLRRLRADLEMSFVAVGGGQLWELRRALNYTKRYVCIEPLADTYINDSTKYLIERAGNISLISKRFDDIDRKDLPHGNSFVMFLFNILAYIETPLEHMNKVIQPGDILFISTWTTTSQARGVRKRYLDHVNELERKVVIDPQQEMALCHLDNFPFDRLRYFNRCERFKGDITDILVIYT